MSQITNPAAGAGYTNEEAQDAVGSILTDTTTIDFTYNDAGNTITADVRSNSISNALLRQSIARSVIGVTGNSTANVADIQGTADQVLRVNSAGTALGFGQINLASSNAVTGVLPIANIPATANVQAFTTPGSTTWTKPSYGSMTYIYVIGGGGGGGSGRRGNSASGGGGGSGGGVSFFTVPTSVLNATETVTVGAGGSGGAAQTTNSTNGNSGSPGGASIFKHGGLNWIVGPAGGGGAGGNAASGSGASAVGQCDFLSATGGNGSTTTGGTSGTPVAGGTGAGGGGGGTASGSTSNGGTAIIARTGTSTAGGVAPGGAGTIGTLAFLPGYAPGGGGSGGASAGDGVTAGGAGGKGGLYGGGGGGGGGSADGANSGAGGDGENGLVLVITV